MVQCNALLLYIVSIHCGKFEMVGVSPAEYPKEKDIKDATKFVISSKLLLNGLDKTSFALPMMN